MSAKHRGPGRPKLHPIDPEEELTVIQICAMTGLAQTTIRSQISNGRIASRVIERESATMRGGLYHLVTRAELHRYLKQRKGHFIAAVSERYQPPEGSDMRGIPVFVDPIVKVRRGVTKINKRSTDDLDAILAREGMGGK